MYLDSVREQAKQVGFKESFFSDSNLRPNKERAMSVTNSRGV